MSYYSNKELEQISVDNVNKMIRKYSSRRIESEISVNDKTPSWDGIIILHEKEGSIGKKDIKCKIDVQVKGKEVAKFHDKSITFAVDINDLKNYLENGIIYFVTEIIPPDEKCKTFFAVLNPMDVQLLLDEVDKKGNKSYINIRLDNKFNSHMKFDVICDEFKLYKDKFNVDNVSNSIPLNNLNFDEDQIVLLNFPKSIEEFDKAIYPFVEDGFNQLIPIRTKFFVNSISFTSKSEFIINNQKIIGNYVEHRVKDETYFSILDGLEYYPDRKEIKLNKARKDIGTRLMTLRLFIEVLDSKKISTLEEKEQEKIKVIKEQIEILEEIIEICEKFNIIYNNILVEDIKKEDLLAIDILKDMKSSCLNINKNSKLEMVIISFLNEKIWALCEENNNIENYYDFYSEDLSLELFRDIGKKRVLKVSRFVLANIDALSCINFNLQVIKDSILDCDFINEMSGIENDYLNLGLNLIKVWDIKRKIEYLDLSKLIFECIEESINEEIYIVNSSQIEYRIYNTLSQETLDKLYKIKFSSNNYNILCSIAILLNDFDGFIKNFKLIEYNEAIQFKEFPIYTLAEKNFTKDKIYKYIK